MEKKYLSKQYELEKELDLLKEKKTNYPPN